MKNLLIIVLGLFITGCVSQYTGQQIDYNNKAVCKCSSLPKSCSVAYPHLTINYTISKGNTPGEYVFSGKASLVENNSMPWMKSGRGSLKLLLGKGVVVDNFSFGLIINANKTTKFSHTFKTEHNFDSVLVGYNMKVRDL